MKKTILFSAGMFFLLLTIGTKAQTPSTDFFVGNWDVLIVGTPNGDAKMPVTLERIDGELKGTFVSNEQAEAPIISKIEETENSITIYFTSSGYDVYLFLEKKGDNKVEGTMMDMFEATGERVIEKEVN